MVKKIADTITPQMGDFLMEFSKPSVLSKNYYFSGGTALSYYYLHHRTSVDLDFFSLQRVDPQEAISFVNAWVRSRDITLNNREVGDTQIFEMRFPNGYNLKVGFAHYPYKQIEPPKTIDGIMVDSKKDIAVNKAVAISQRTDVKDFVDLYFLLNEYSILDLFDLSNRKFRRDYDLMLFASDLLKVKDFDYLPNMLVDLNLVDLKKYYLDLAKNLGLSFTAE